MAVGPKRLRELARELAKHMGPVAGSHSQQPSIGPAPPAYDVMREAHIRRIRHLAKAYRLQWLVDQETYGYGSLTDVDEIGLSNLVLILERARECIVEGIGFDDAGLVRSVSLEQRAPIACSHAEQQAQRSSRQMLRERAVIPRLTVAEDAPF